MYNCWNEAVKYLYDKNGQIKKRISEEIATKMKLLMNQYYYGIQAKKELYYFLVDLGVINLVESN